MKTRNTELIRNIANATLIIIHGGLAVHFDEFMACAIARWCGCPAPIVRRNPTEEELVNPSVLVMDVGMTLDETKLSFDHHQDKELGSAYCILSCLLGIDEELDAIFPWFGIWSDIDAHGPYVAAENQGMDWEKVSPFLNPISESVLRLWGQDTAWGEPILKDLANTLHEVLDIGPEGLTPWQYVDQCTVILELDGKIVLNMCGIDRYRAVQSAYVRAKNASVKVFDDDREPYGFGLTRCNNDLDIDFNRVKGEPGVGFVHPSGFIAKTTGKDVEWVDLVRKAIKA